MAAHRPACGQRRGHREPRLNAEASFHQTSDGESVLIGEVTLTAAEVEKVADRLQQGGVEITALHKHIQAETPRLWWMHYWALGRASA